MNTGNNQGDGREMTPKKNLAGTALKQCLFLVVLACLLGWTFNYPLVVKSLGGELLAEIQQKQLADLKAKAEQLSTDIRFIDLISAKKLFDERQAIFLDARSPEEHAAGTITGSIGISLMSVVKGEVVLEEAIPDHNAVIVTYCSGGECDVGVEMAKELVERGYTNVYVLGEGYPGWLDAGYPVSNPNGGDIS
ncbi:rhodanese-like domain-containing protein [Desulfoscipio geothermicus]|uniref:Rhodanese-related sulfurtransferase n=1 Tax=Desulfoscipio geothermicus DSM 3669 TaxID=1121426 RepID=A0A1I6D288_9FIRM|nr:rhodanese-like domain-containing protein [Desulfoscipio geothermicus]SFQ99491.1 Rhodanese-related sulfurtransferase [Desulfoscipio geothermicus DSM 3669]